MDLLLGRRDLGRLAVRQKLHYDELVDRWGVRLSLTRSIRVRNNLVHLVGPVDC